MAGLPTAGPLMAPPTRNAPKIRKLVFKAIADDLRGRGGLSERVILRLLLWYNPMLPLWTCLECLVPDSYYLETLGAE